MPLFAAWLLAAVSTLGALFFGEVMGLPTCSLCWYQRICMFPLALILPFALFPLDRGVIRYALVLAVPGLFIAVYHQLLVMGIIPEAAAPCRQGVPCSQTVATWFGFVTLPILSIAAFASIVALLAIAALRRSP
ncbi:MAG: disulfide bond formation protein B [Rhodocyclaceae bacterium]|nr:disulfide bond formation protein B [Rhodocyclaceae bacterium]